MKHALQIAIIEAWWKFYARVMSSGRGQSIIKKPLISCEGFNKLEQIQLGFLSLHMSFECTSSTTRQICSTM